VEWIGQAGKQKQSVFAGAAVDRGFAYKIGGVLANLVVSSRKKGDKHQCAYIFELLLE